MKDYKATIGLEIHAELKTASKMFCSCKNDADESKPNINICPICTGHPGTLPTLNKEAIKHVLKIGNSIGGNIANFTEWDRKNYFYPDIPKGYQISQYKYPLVTGGELAGVQLTRIHLEEDTAQSTHDTHDKSLINFNRAGVPLMELVTEPVIHDAITAVKFAKELRLLLRYIGAGEANLEKGEMRVEANISVSKISDGNILGTKTEVKNLNSFRAVEKAINFEIERQIKLLEKGEKVIQETRGWDENKSTTYSQRLKESSHDYRYFPDPDLPKLMISEIEEFKKENLIKEITATPWEKRVSYITDFGMTEKEVEVFVENREVGKYFEDVVLVGGEKIVRLAVNYILNDYLGLLKKEGKEINFVEPNIFAELLIVVENKTIQSNALKSALMEMVKSSDTSTHKEILNKNKSIKKIDEGEIKKIIEEIIAGNSTVVDDYKKGKMMALQFLVGQGMKVTKGSVNPEILKKIIVESIV